MIFHDEVYVNICTINNANDIQFSDKFMEITSAVSNKRRELASKLITHWDSETASLLDYFGDNDGKDLYTGIDGEPMDIREDVMDLWEYKEAVGFDIPAEWYRDLLRAKLVTIALPEHLLVEYVRKYMESKK